MKTVPRIALSAVYQNMGKTAEAQSQLDLLSNIKKVYEANGVAMDAEIEQMMTKAGIRKLPS